MPPAQDLTNLTLDGRYRLTRLMGEGGMGQVYEGVHELLDRKVAVKVLLPRFAYDAKFRERFLREAKAASKVRHPNVVQILDFGDTPGGSVYFAMEYLEGRDLQAILRQEGPLSWGRARHLLLQMVSALGAAHERSIIHRDIKPANFFIIEARGLAEFVKVLDFGIAKIAAEPGKEDSSLAQSLTGTGEVFGTAKYMAPEQAYGASDDPRVDVYSVGIVAYEMLTGRVPFSGVSAFHIITRHVNDRPQPPRELVPTIPPEVEAVILRALAKQPADRFASMDELERALAEIPAEPGTGTERSLVHSVPPPSAHSRPVVAGGAGVPVAVPVVSSAGVGVGAAAMPPAAVPAPASPAPRPAIAPGVGVAQPRPRVVSDQVTAPSLEPKQPREQPSPGPAPPARPGSGTAVIPTRLRAPSAVTSGEVGGVAGAPSRSMAGAGSGALGPVADGTGPRGRASGAPDDSSTAPMPGTMDGGSATGPQDPRASARQAYDTNPHTPMSSSEGSRSRAVILGLLGMLAAAGGVIAAFVAAQPDEGSASAPTVAAVESRRAEGAVEVAPTVVPEPASPSDPSPSDPSPVDAAEGDAGATAEGGAVAGDIAPTPTPPVEATAPGPAPVEPARVETQRAEPAKPEPKKKQPSERKTSTNKPAPLTDAKVKSRLASSMKRKCRSKGSSAGVKVKLIVATKGNVLNANGAVTGATPELRQCLEKEIAAAEFAQGSSTRRLEIPVGW